jgi:hypothetical protein
MRCIFTENTSFEGGAVTATNSTFDNCSIVKNSASLGSGVQSIGGSLWFANSIIAFGTGGAGVHCGPDIILSCCDVFGNEGGDRTGCISGQLGIDGNIAEDPLFCDLMGGDFSLCADSPCAPEQSACGLMGMMPVGCASCAMAVEPTTWGRIKALHRR